MNKEQFENMQADERKWMAIGLKQNSRYLSQFGLAQMINLEAYESLCATILEMECAAYGALVEAMRTGAPIEKGIGAVFLESVEKVKKMVAEISDLKIQETTECQSKEVH